MNGMDTRIARLFSAEKSAFTNITDKGTIVSTRQHAILKPVLTFPLRSSLDVTVWASEKEAESRLEATNPAIITSMTNGSPFFPPGSVSITPYTRS